MKASATTSRRWSESRIFGSSAAGLLLLGSFVFGCAQSGGGAERRHAVVTPAAVPVAAQPRPAMAETPETPAWADREAGAAARVDRPAPQE